MKHYLITAIIMALCLVPITSHAYDFSAVNDDGVTIYYYIISEEEKTCAVADNFIEGAKARTSSYSGNIIIPSLANGYKVVSISSYAFINCKNLYSVTIPSSVKSIGQAAFYGCTGLTSLEIPNSVTYLGDYSTFDSCTGLTSINIPNSVTSIGLDLFRGCTSLTSIEIPNSVTSIGARAFSQTGLTSIEIPNSVTSIEGKAFAYCTNLHSVTIPKSVTKISIHAYQVDYGNPFAACPNLESIIVEEGNEKYNSADNCNAIVETNSGTLITGCKSTVITNSVKAIGAYSFDSCTGLTSITIPSSVTAIGENAFNKCTELTSVTIPSTVTSIGGYAFSGCTNLSTVYSRITSFFDINSSVFQGCKNTTLYVPKGMGNFYRVSTGWRVFKYIEEMPDDTPDASFLVSCSNKGSISINGEQNITGKIDMANIIEDSDNTFTFTPKPGCRLDQVILNGLDITANVVNNTLTCTIPANSQMIVTFSSEQGDMNNDGTLDISDVVSIVNKILGN